MLLAHRSGHRIFVVCMKLYNYGVSRAINSRDFAQVRTHSVNSPPYDFVTASETGSDNINTLRTRFNIFCEWYLHR